MGKHDVLLKESAADICSKLASLLKSLKDLLTVSLYGNKGKFEEDDLRSIFAAYDMDVPSAKRFYHFVTGVQGRGGQKCELHHQCQEEKMRTS